MCLSPGSGRGKCVLHMVEGGERVKRKCIPRLAVFHLILHITSLFSFLIRFKKYEIILLKIPLLVVPMWLQQKL